MALAYISGNLKMLKKRSLLTGQENSVTVHVRTSETFRGVYFVWTLLKRVFPERLVDGIKGIRIESSMNGAVFDLTEEQWERMEEIYNREREHKTNLSFEMSLAKELPELLEQDDNVSSGGGSSRENGNSGYSRGGDRGPRRDSGYGGSSGGWGWNRNENSGSSNGHSRGGPP